MILDFTVNEQTLTWNVVDKRVVANSKNYLKCKFSFSEEWNGINKTAIFSSSKDVSYCVLLDEDMCTVPWEVIEYPYFAVSVYGGDLITANKVLVDVTKSGYTEGETPKEPSPTVYEQLLNSMKSPYIGENGNWYEWDVETKGYVDSGVCAKGDIEAVYVPTKVSEFENDVGYVKEENLDLTLRMYQESINAIFEELPRIDALEVQMGDIETALDNIIAIQNSLIGGDAE